MARKFKIVLASSSPRRRRLMEQLGIPFDVVDPGEVEVLFGRPEEMARENAVAKAVRVAKQFEEGIVVGADTVVTLGGMVLGNPQDPSEAEWMLRALRGSTHKVITGIAVVDARRGRLESDVVETQVKMLPLSDGEISVYVATGESLGKAGGYAIQGLGAILVEEIHGCFYNVVGLPLSRLDVILKRFGVHILNNLKNQH